jgi:hypothetical protein
MLGGETREARAAVCQLSTIGDPTVVFENENGQRMDPRVAAKCRCFVVIPAWKRRNSVTGSTKRMRDKRARDKESPQVEKKSDVTSDALEEKRGEEIREEKTPLPPKRKRKAMVETELPEEWEPTKSHRDFAAEHNLDLKLQVVAFRGHYDGRLEKSWNGRFATWLARKVEWQREREPKETPKRVHATELERLQHELAEARKTAERTGRGDHWQQVQSLEHACSHERERIQQTHKRNTPNLFAVAGKA